MRSSLQNSSNEGQITAELRNCCLLTLWDAEHYFHEALKRDARLATAHFGLAKIYDKQGKTTLALEEATAAEKLDPNSSSLHYLRGRLLQKLRKTQAADAEFGAVKRLLAAKQTDNLAPESTPNPDIAAPR